MNEETSISLFLLEKKLLENNTQQVISKLSNFPMIHFSDDAENILVEGFQFGSSLDNIDYSFTDNPEHKIKEQKGYIYTFNPLNTLTIEDSFSFFDYQISLNTNLIGMYNSKAILFLGNGLYTKHQDGFNQIISHSDDISLNNSILLSEIQIEEPICDENGNDIDSIWIATFNNKIIVNENKYCKLEECVGHSLKYLIQQNIIKDNDIIDLFKEQYNGIINTKINSKKIKLNF